MIIIEDFIIVHADGRPIYPEYVSQMFTKLQKRVLRKKQLSRSASTFTRVSRLRDRGEVVSLAMTCFCAKVGEGTVITAAKPETPRESQQFRR